MKVVNRIPSIGDRSGKSPEICRRLGASSFHRLCVFALGNAPMTVMDTTKYAKMPRFSSSKLVSAMWCCGKLSHLSLDGHFDRCFLSMSMVGLVIALLLSWDAVYPEPWATRRHQGQATDGTRHGTCHPDRANHSVAIKGRLFHKIDLDKNGGC